MITKPSSIAASLFDAKMKEAPTPKSILVLAGSRHEFYQYRYHACCEESKRTNKHVKVESPFGQQFVDGSNGNFHGYHFDGVIITGTFYERVDSAQIFNYAHACLNPNAVILERNLAGAEPMKCSKCGAYTSKVYSGSFSKNLCLHCAKIANEAVVKKAKALGIDPPKKAEPTPMKHGEVRRLPKANSPMWTTQWAVQGSGKLPYIVSKKDTPNGATTAEGWACACGSFTSNTPRAECKHIMWVMKAENIAPSSPAGLPEDQKEAFKKFLEHQQAVAAIPKKGIVQGRRFR